MAKARPLWETLTQMYPNYPLTERSYSLPFAVSYPIPLSALTTYIRLFHDGKLECPLEGCHATIEAETEQEIMSQAEAHANSSHPEVELDDETVENIRSRIQDV